MESAVKTLGQLIDEAIQQAARIRTITRDDGTSFQFASGYGSAEREGFQVYVISVTARTVYRRDHYRITYYVRDENGKYNRTSRQEFISRMAA